MMVTSQTPSVIAVSALSINDDVNKHLNNLAVIAAKVSSIQLDFENSKRLQKGDSHLESLIGAIKAEKSVIDRERNQINALLTSMHNYDVINRVYLEFTRIECDGYDEALNQMAYEVLAYQAGVTQFKPTYVSDAINIATALLSSRFQHLVGLMADVDTKLANIMSHINKTNDLRNELILLNELSQVMNLTSYVKNNYYREYLTAQETAQGSGMELSILQRSEVEMHVAMLNWLAKFAHTYQELVLRLLGH